MGGSLVEGKHRFELSCTSLTWSHQDESKADVYRLPLDSKRRVKLTSDVSLRTALQTTNAVHVWSLWKTDWKEYRVEEAIPVGNHDTILVRAPDIEGLQFFGIELEQLLMRDTPCHGLKALRNADHVTIQRAAQPLPADLSTPLLSGVQGALDNIFY